jgi:cell division septum initiation protein DivIVA
VPKATSTSPGRSPARAPARARKSAGAQTASTERKAAKVVDSAGHEAGRIRAEAEEHARRLVLDARASADGVRAEGMEVVSNLRQISDTLREMAERVLADVEAIHTRMVSELERVEALGGGAEADAAVGGDIPSARAATAGSSAATVGPSAASGAAEEQLDVPDFVARG